MLKTSVGWSRHRSPWPRVGPSLAFVVAALAGPAALPAQSVLPAEAAAPDASYVRLEMMMPRLAQGREATSGTSVIFVGGRFPLAHGWAIVSEVPFAHAALRDAGLTGGDASYVLGNPYIGVELQRPSSATTAEFGVRLPLGGSFDGDAYAAYVGGYADLDRVEAFQLQHLAVRAGFDSTLRNSPRIGARIRGDIVTSIQMDHLSYDDLGSLFVGYGTEVWYGVQGIRIGGALTGRAGVGRVGGELVGWMAHHMVLTASTAWRETRPALFLRRPLDERTGEHLDFVVGMRVEVDLR